MKHFVCSLFGVTGIFFILRSDYYKNLEYFHKKSLICGTPGKLQLFLIKKTMNIKCKNWGENILVMKYFTLGQFSHGQVIFDLPRVKKNPGQYFRYIFIRNKLIN